MIKVFSNSLGSGDWIAVTDDVGTIWEGHSIKPSDLEYILQQILIGPGIPVKLVEIDDERMESGRF